MKAFKTLAVFVLIFKVLFIPIETRKVLKCAHLDGSGSDEIDVCGAKKCPSGEIVLRSNCSCIVKPAPNCSNGLQISIFDEDTDEVIKELCLLTNQESNYANAFAACNENGMNLYRITREEDFSIFNSEDDFALPSGADLTLNKIWIAGERSSEGVWYLDSSNTPLWSGVQVNSSSPDRYLQLTTSGSKYEVVGAKSKSLAIVACEF